MLNEAIKLTEIQGNGIGKNKNPTKYIMNLIGVEVGEPRLPFLPLSDTEREMIRNALAKWCEQNEYAFITYK